MFLAYVYVRRETRDLPHPQRVVEHAGTTFWSMLLRYITHARTTVTRSC